MALNEYDEMIETGALPAGNEYDQMLADGREEQKQQVAGSMFVASQTTPDKRAQAYELSKKTQLPVEIVERNFDTISKKHTAGSVDYDGIIDKTPKLAEWLKDPNNAALSSDDLAALGKTHQLKNVYEENSQIYNALYSGLNQFNQGLMKVPTYMQNLYYAPANLLRKMRGEQQIEYKYNEGVTGELAQWYGDAAQKAIEASPDLSASVVEQIKEGNYSAAGRALALKVLQNAPNQTFLVGSAMMGMPQVGLGVMGSTTAAQEASQLQEQGVDPLTQTTVGAAYGAIETAFESLGTLGVLKQWDNAIAKQWGKQVSKEVMKDLAKTLGYSFMAEGNEEALTSLAQDFTEYMSGANPDAMKGAASRALEAGLIGGFSGVTMSSPAGVAQGVNRMQQIQQVRINQEFYRAIGENAQESKLNQRLPEKYQEYVKELTKDGPVENIYIPLQAIEQYFQDRSDSPVKMAGELNILQEYEAAKEAGTDVKISTAKMASELAGTEHFQNLARDIKYSPDQFTANELIQQEQEAKAKLQEEQAVYEQEVEKAKTAEQEAREVRDNVAARLVEAGMSKRDAKTYAKQYEAFSNVMSKRAHMSPKEFLARYGLRINGRQVIPGTETGQVPTQVYEQTRFTPEYNAEEDKIQIKDKDVRVSGQMVATDPAQFVEDFVNPEGVYDTKVDVAEMGLDKFERPFEVDSIEVSKKKRGKGIGSEALRAIEQEAMKQGADVVFLNASPTGVSDKAKALPNLIKFYEKNGYKVIRKSDGNAEMYKPLVDEYSYRMDHRPPGFEGGAPAHDLTGNNNAIYPNDFYSNKALQYYGTGATKADSESISVLHSIKGKPNAKVKIYRAVPSSETNAQKVAKLEKQLYNYLRRGRLPTDAFTNDKARWYEATVDKVDALKNLPQEEKVVVDKINSGDLVTLSKSYAKEHGENNLGGHYKILTKTVLAKELFTNGDSVNEFGYWKEDDTKSYYQTRLDTIKTLEQNKANLEKEGFTFWASEDPYFNEEGEEIEGPALGEDGSHFSVYAQDPVGNDIATARFKIEEGELVPDDGDGAYEAVTVDASFRRKGIATELYRLASETAGKPVSNKSWQTDSGKAFREALRDLAPETFYQDRSNLSPLGFYSQVERSIEGMDFKEMPAKDLANRIKNIQGIKKEELEWLGLEDWLNAQAEQDPKAKVSKEEVLEFVRGNGVQLEQVVLGEIEDPGLTEDVSFSEEEFIPLSEYDRSDYESAVENEIDYRLSDKKYDDSYTEIVEGLRENYTDEETGEVDESALEQAATTEFIRSLEEWAEKYVDSEDYYDAKFKVVEQSTGFTLVGNSERGWYSGELNKWYEDNIEEAKIQFLNDLIENGYITGSINELVRASDLAWHSPSPSYPTKATITKKAKALLAAEPERMRQLSEEYNESLRDDPESFAKEVEDDLIKMAEREVRETYEDEANEKNKFSIVLSSGYPDGRIEGSIKSGFEFSYSYDDAEGTTQQGSIKFKAASFDEAKSKAVAHLVENKIVAPAKEAVAQEGEAPVDINAPTDEARWKRYSVIGGATYREILLTLPKTEDVFTYDTHFRGQQNFVAHARVSDAVVDGKKILFIEEIQSDWHQQGRERGYSEGNIYKLRTEREKIESELDSYHKQLSKLKSDTMEKANNDTTVYQQLVESDEFAEPFARLSAEIAKLEDVRKEVQNKIEIEQKTVPDAPFKQTDAWASLVMKRLIRMSAEQGYDGIAWTPADVHVNRWGTDHVSWVKREGGFVIVDKHGEELKNIGVIEDRKLADLTLERITNRSYIENFEKSLRSKDFDVDYYLSDASFVGMARAAERSGLVSREDAAAYVAAKQARATSVTDGMKVKELSQHWLVGSAEQRGGFADGMSIEEIARARGKLLEKDGERVTSKEELHKVIGETLGRERTDRSLGSITDRVWKKMQAGDSAESLSGAIAPRKEGMEFFYNKMLPDVTKKLLAKTDKSAKVKVFDMEKYADEGEGFEGKALGFELTPELKKVALEQGFSLFQPGQDGPLGKIEVGNASINIELLKGADRSTFLHETGHFMLEVMKDLASQDNIPDDIKKDAEILAKWLGVESLADVKVEQHEMFARAMEAYLMEGKAPSEGLRKVFSKFKTWLTDIYKTLVNLNVELTDEVRDVFDRMLATEEEIAQAKKTLEFKSIFGDPSKVGMSEAQQLEYLNAMALAELDATEALDKLLLKEVERKQDKAYKDRYKALYDEEMAKAKEMLPFRVWDGLKGELKLSKPLLERDYKPFVEYVPRGTTKVEGGMNPDVVAEIFGYKNGYHMMQEIMPYRKGLKDFVEREVATRLRVEFPELLMSPELSEEAIKAFHNDNYKKMKRLELEYLANNDPKVLKTVANRLIRRLIPDEVVKKQARQILAKVPVRDIRPHQYRLAERRFAREAADNYTKGEFALAFEAKQRELLNIELYIAATEAKVEVEKDVDKFKKLFRQDEKMAKNYDMNLVNVARAVLATYGLGRTEKTAEEYLAPIKRYEPQLYESALILMAQAMPEANAVEWKYLTYDQFVTLRDAVTALADLARSSREMEIEGRKVNIDDIREELVGQAAKVSKASLKSTHLGDLTKREKFRDSIHSMKASLVRIEHWADAMDVQFGGPFRKYVFQPVSDAVTTYRLNKYQKLTEYKNILKKYQHRLTDGAILAPELGRDENGVPMQFKNKAELMMAVLHSGNNSNLYKLLAGWGLTEMADDGTFDRTAWDNFRSRMYKDGILNQEDMDMAQEIWDLMESMKPETQKAHKKIMGFYFSEITANEIETPFGTYKGGYIPAKADPSKAVDANIREQKNAFDDVASSFSFPTTGRGATMSRVDRYAAPLRLDMSMLGTHIDWAMRFTYIEPVVRDVARVVMGKAFQTEMNKLSPHMINEAVIPWLQRSAQQTVVEPSRYGLGRGIDTVAKFVRSSVGRQIMFANVPNAMQQFTGVIVAAAKVRPKYLRNALVRYISSPNKLALENESKSEWLQSTQGADLFEVHQAIEEIVTNPSTFEKFSDFTKRHAYFLQVATQNAVNTVVWSGAYEEAISNGKPEAEAVKHADAAVRLTQGSMSPEDVSRFETGTATQLLFKQFVGYFNMLANLNAFEAQRIAREMGIKNGKGKLFYLYLTGFAIPAILSEAIMVAFAGKGLDQDDDDEYLDDLLGLFFGSQIRTALATLPFGGQTMVATIDRFSKGPQGGRLNLSPVISTIDTMAGVPALIAMGVSKGEIRKKGVRDALMAMGVITGLPLAPLGKPIGYMMDVESGKASPSGPIDFTRGLVTGKPGR